MASLYVVHSLIYAYIDASTRLTKIPNLSAVTLAILSVQETNVRFQCLHYLQLSTAFAAVANTCGFKHVSIRIALFILNLINCAERNHQQPLAGFSKLRIAIDSEKQNETRVSTPARLQGHTRVMQGKASKVSQTPTAEFQVISQ